MCEWLHNLCADITQTQSYENTCCTSLSPYICSYYNHVLYGNRAQAYLKNKQYKKSLSDGKRAVVLKNDWAKVCLS